MTEKKVYLDWKTVFEFMRDAFVAVGVPASDAEICAEIMD